MDIMDNWISSCLPLLAHDLRQARKYPLKGCTSNQHIQRERENKEGSNYKTLHGSKCDIRHGNQIKQPPVEQPRSSFRGGCGGPLVRMGTPPAIDFCASVCVPCEVVGLGASCRSTGASWGMSFDSQVCSMGGFSGTFLPGLCVGLDPRLPGFCFGLDPRLPGGR